MSYHQTLSTGDLLQSPRAPAKRPANTRLKHSASVPAPTFHDEGGGIAQSFRRLSSFVRARKKATVCILAAVGGLIWFAAPFSKEFTLTDLLHEVGYWETMPPAEYYLPGTINTLEVTSDGRVSLHPTCKISPELLSRIILQSRTVDRNLGERLNKKFAITEKLKSFLPFEISGTKVRNVSLSLRNSNIMEITDEELIQIQKEVIIGACQEAIEINISSGATVCQTRSVLRGDLVYEISYEKNGSAGVKDPGVQVEPGQETKTQVVGNGLIYGVNFVPYGIVRDTLDAKPADCRTLARHNA